MRLGDLIIAYAEAHIVLGLRLTQVQCCEYFGVKRQNMVPHFRRWIAANDTARYDGSIKTYTPTGRKSRLFGSRKEAVSYLRKLDSLKKISEALDVSN